MGLGRWLWRVVDVRWLGYNIGQILKGADAAGQILQETEPRTIQHHSARHGILAGGGYWFIVFLGVIECRLRPLSKHDALKAGKKIDQPP